VTDDKYPRTAPHPILTEYYRSDAEREGFVTALFDSSARHYDRLCQLMSFGSGQWYRRQALLRAGVTPGMRVLDVATGTGLVARSALAILGDPRAVIGLDPSAGMLREARRASAAPLVQGQVETLPFPRERFDVLTFGYALRHVTDLEIAFTECRRVLKPGGRLLVLEISRAQSRATRAALRLYFLHVLPAIMWVSTRSTPARMLSQYYWQTIDACVPPDTILDVLRRSGFVDVHRNVFGGFLSEYIAVNPAH
jgi:demethylmenaquinone methyltransferase / 2-methoxy-6-polyprenyl-1,4-benzoquinol methylase